MSDEDTGVEVGATALEAGHEPALRYAGATSALERPSELRIQRFGLRVVSGPDRGTTRQSSAFEFTVGTAPGNDLVLTDTTVSRHHCAVIATADGFLLRDLQSTNGTVLGEHRIQSAFLRPLAVVRIGRSALVFESAEGVVCEPLADEDRFGRMVGSSPAIRRVFALLPRIAASSSTVLIEGETGTGKGLLADALHRESPRRSGPFVVVDCGAIPTALIEAELFGHERGAFTGAHTARPGAFEAARGGTVFLDEIGELPLDMQPKLLRALEDRVVKRLGSVDPVALDVRVVAATSRDLRREVNAGTFRSDLFYRLNVVKLRLPPLRERREDIPLLTQHFYSQLAGQDDPHPPADLVEALVRQELPGNVRELRSAVERSVLLGDPALAAELAGDELTPVPVETVAIAEASASPAEPDFSVPFRAAKERLVSGWERGYLTELLGRTSGNLSRAARLARMDRNHLRELVRRYKLRASDD
ncbi:MAG TPA: sigma 54-interacting transcriptional regulator [Kofleriaceae bacterium]|nr:sigma 54-interacting transcriptional regulator [Kofleriaceae bacterium]